MGAELIAWRSSRLLVVFAALAVAALVVAYDARRCTNTKPRMPSLMEEIERMNRVGCAPAECDAPLSHSYVRPSDAEIFPGSVFTVRTYVGSAAEIP